jgi:Mg2+ and Co2+ transporter CorA
MVRNNQYVKYNGRSYKVQKNGTFWSKYTTKDHMKTIQKQFGIKPYFTIKYMGKERRVYEHKTDTVGQHTIEHTVDGFKFFGTNYTNVHAAREFENIYDSDRNFVKEIPRVWSGSYFFSEYTPKDRQNESPNFGVSNY